MYESERYICHLTDFYYEPSIDWDHFYKFYKNPPTYFYSH